MHTEISEILSIGGPQISYIHVLDSLRSENDFIIFETCNSTIIRSKLKSISFVTNFWYAQLVVFQGINIMHLLNRLIETFSNFPNTRNISFFTITKGYTTLFIGIKREKVFNFSYHMLGTTTIHIPMVVDSSFFAQQTQSFVSLRNPLKFEFSGGW